jgi:hypothetical protein
MWRNATTLAGAAAAAVQSSGSPAVSLRIYLKDASLFGVSFKSDDQACPVVAGVVDASQCLGGFNSTDSTAALQAAINAGGAHTVIISNGSRATPWVTRPLFIRGVSNRTVWLGPGVVIVALRGGFKSRWDSLLQIESVANVSIRVGDPTEWDLATRAAARSPPNPARLEMWKRDYWDCGPGGAYNRSEWRHGISIGNEWVPGAYGPAMCQDVTISGGEDGLRIVHNRARMFLVHVEDRSSW